MRQKLVVLALSLSAFADQPSLTVQVDLNRADTSRPLRPQHEVAFQLESRPPGSGGAPGGLVKIYRITPKGPEFVDSIKCPPRPADSPATVKATGFLYRQLFIWPGWRSAGSGHYQARYTGKAPLKIDFQLP